MAKKWTRRLAPLTFGRGRVAAPQVTNLSCGSKDCRASSRSTTSATSTTAD
ncbi:MAG: hypothetical protein U0270_37575 [Labilithrix sp.]